MPVYPLYRPTPFFSPTGAELAFVVYHEVPVVPLYRPTPFFSPTGAEMAFVVYHEGKETLGFTSTETIKAY